MNLSKIGIITITGSAEVDRVAHSDGTHRTELDVTLTTEQIKSV